MITFTSTAQEKQLRKPTGELDLKECFGERLTVLGARGEALLRRGGLLTVSLRGARPGLSPDRTGSTATAPGSAPADFFLLDGGMSEAGKLFGTGSISMARYTRCMT